MNRWHEITAVAALAAALGTPVLGAFRFRLDRVELR